MATLYYFDVSSLYPVAYRCRDWNRVGWEIFEYCCVAIMDLRVYTCVRWHVNAAPTDSETRELYIQVNAYMGRTV